MAIEANTSLTRETLNTLNELIQLNIDAEKGFEEAAETIEDMNIASMFREFATQRSSQAAELQTHVLNNSEQPTKTGSFTATAHRAWMNLRSVLGGGNQAILNEAERGEDHIKAKYEDALKCCEANAVNDVLKRQYAAVKQAHDRVRDMRDSYDE